MSDHQLILVLYYLSAVTLGAGVQWGEAYDFARKQGRFVVGGTSASVGASGGWVMGGGHSAYSPKFGLGTLTASPILFYFVHAYVNNIMIQASITFFSLLLSLVTDLLSLLTPSNTRICFGRYVVVAGAPTVS